MKQSAGLLLFRKIADELEVLLVHPSGAYNRRAPWSIPKGLPDKGESLEAAACRETMEETGVEWTGPLVALGSMEYQKSRKRIFAFAAEVDATCVPKCASWEVDRADFLKLENARELIHPDQAVFLTG